MSCAQSPSTLDSLVATAQGGDRKARDQVVARCMPLVRRLAAKFQRPDLTDDLVQAGIAGPNMTDGSSKVAGLLRAIETYQPGNGATFATWATRWVRGAMRREHARLCDETGITGRVRARMALVRRKARQLEHERNDGTRPDPVEVLIAVRAESKERLALPTVERALQPKPRGLSLDANNPDLAHGGGALFAALSDGNSEGSRIAELDQKRAAEELCTALKRMRLLRAELLRMRYGLCGYRELSLEQIGEFFGRSKFWASRECAAAADELREMLG
jgi:RNA polymerase sigma factor (sigma-70 family)